MEEIWLPIKGYESIYEISNFGSMRSIPATITLKDGKVRERKGVVLKISKRGRYMSKSLFKDGVYKSYTVHRLVALAFIPNPDSKPHINHIDNNRYNNRADNLEWVTQKENLKHAAEQGRMKKPPVNFISPEKLQKAKDLLDQGVTRRDVERQLNMSGHTINSYFGKKLKKSEKEKISCDLTL